MNAHPEIVPSLVDRKQTLVGLKMPRAIEILDCHRASPRTRQDHRRSRSLSLRNRQAAFKLAIVEQLRQ